MFQITDAFTETLALGYIDAEYDEWPMATFGSDGTVTEFYVNPRQIYGSFSVRF